MNDGVSRFFPETGYQGLTIRRLMNHTGGLDDYDDEMRGIWETGGRIPDNSAIVRIPAENKPELLFAPGEKFSYSHSGYWLLAEIIEKASGVKFEEFMRKEVFEPAGLLHTRVIHPIKTGEYIENLAASMVKKYPEPEHGQSASETGRNHIPPRIFKEMTRLDKQRRKLKELLAGVTTLSPVGCGRFAGWTSL